LENKEALPRLWELTLELSTEMLALAERGDFLRVALLDEERRRTLFAIAGSPRGTLAPALASALTTAQKKIAAMAAKRLQEQAVLDGKARLASQFTQSA